MPTSSLSPIKRRFALAVIEEDTIEAAAARVGRSRRTGFRWMQDPDLQAAIFQMQDAIMANECLRTIQAMGAARETLIAIHMDPDAPATARVAAARALRGEGPKKQAEQIEFVRLPRIEQRVYGGWLDDDEDREED